MVALDERWTNIQEQEPASLVESLYYVRRPVSSSSSIQKLGDTGVMVSRELGDAGRPCHSLNHGEVGGTQCKPP